MSSDKGQGSFVQPIRLDITVVPVWGWSPGESLESCQFAVHVGILKNWGSNTTKGMPQL